MRQFIFQRFPQGVLLSLLAFSCGAHYGTSGEPEKLERAFEKPSLETLPPSAICSKLDFKGFQWPVPSFDFENEGFQLALNITGSFEGHYGWENLTNDFDGQGLSVGLLNQNLGTGSLQPLLVKFRDRYPNDLRLIFRNDHLNSLLGMLDNWEKSGLSQKDLEQMPYQSPLDIDYPDDELTAQGIANDSVLWARQNLYIRPNQFDPLWKVELINLIGSPGYIALQVEEAWKLHRQSVALQKWMNVPEVRAYLFMFDIIVQNGGLKSGVKGNDKTDYLTWAKKNPTATSTQKLSQLMELRLRHVKPRFVSDVRERKSALINGSGRVHGAQRNFESEYCFSSLFNYSPKILP